MREKEGETMLMLKGRRKGVDVVSKGSRDAAPDVAESGGWRSG